MKFIPFLILGIFAFFGNMYLKENHMKIVTTAFESEGTIPQKYTCQGSNVSPPLQFLNIPTGTVALALIVDDPDAPSGTFTHWLAWNISPNLTGLTEGMHLDKEGVNDFGKIQYSGPCPPAGKLHRYYFKLYALDKELPLPRGASKEQLEKALEGHIKANAELMGTFQR